MQILTRGRGDWNRSSECLSFAVEGAGGRGSPGATVTPLSLTSLADYPFSLIVFHGTCS